MVPAPRTRWASSTPSPGPLASYGKQYRQGLTAGIDYATKGTGAVAGHTIQITEQDDAGDPAKAVASATDLIGQGNTIIAGSTSSGVALQVAPLAKDNKVLFISGPAAADAVTGANRYTFRSGRQTYQDVATAGQHAGRRQGQEGHRARAGQRLRQGQRRGGHGRPRRQGRHGRAPSRCPSAATDLTPFATKVKGGTPRPALRRLGRCQRHGDVDDPRPAGRLRLHEGRHRSRHQGDARPLRRGRDEDQLPLALLRGRGRQRRPTRRWTQDSKKQGATVDLFTNDGFVAGQMIVHALESGGGDVDKMVTSLEGWTFDGPKGSLEIRAEDHALLQPMFTATLKKDGSNVVPQLVDTLQAAAVAPPVTPFK